jgi:hypothetical protein
MKMKTKKIAAIAAASTMMLMGGAWAQGWMSSGASSGAGYATPGTTQFNGNTVSPIITPYDTMSSGSSSAAAWSSNAAGTSGTGGQITGYVPPDQTAVDRAEVHQQASAFARLRANASGEDPSYPARQQLFIGTAPGSEPMQQTQ